MLEAQKRDRWVPKVGSMIFVPRMRGNFKVRFTNMCNRLPQSYRVLRDQLHLQQFAELMPTHG